MDITKAIPLTAGSITIINFLFSIIPISSNPPLWFQKILEFSSTSKFVLVFILLFFISSTINRLIIGVHRAKITPSQKWMMISFSIIVISWSLVFNIKGVAFSNDLSTGKNLLFVATSLYFYIQNSWLLHKEFEYENIVDQGTIATPFWLDENNYTPSYIRSIRFFIYWLVIFYGFIYFDF